MVENLKNLESFLKCPKGHHIQVCHSNYARDYSSGEVDAKDTTMPLHEPGLHCYGCNRAYGLSKLSIPQTEPVR